MAGSARVATQAAATKPASTDSPQSNRRRRRHPAGRPVSHPTSQAVWWRNATPARPH